MKQYMKKFFKKHIFRSGTTQTILLGPLRGKKIIVNELTGWAHLYGGWEPDAQNIYRRHIKKNNVIYDLGANTGIHSLLFSQLTGQDGKVFAFEPLLANIQEIESIIRLNELTNITIVRKAVSETSGTAEFDEGPNNFQGSLTSLNGSTRKIKVETTSLDDFLDKNHPKPDFIKMDIEGGEGSALAGFQKWIKKCRPIMSIDLHTPEQDLLVGRFFSENRYDVFRLRNDKAKSKKLLSEIKYLNRSWPDPNGIWGTVIALPKKN